MYFCGREASCCHSTVSILKSWWRHPHLVHLSAQVLVVINLHPTLKSGTVNELTRLSAKRTERCKYGAKSDSFQVFLQCPFYPGIQIRIIRPHVMQPPPRKKSRPHFRKNKIHHESTNLLRPKLKLQNVSLLKHWLWEGGKDTGCLWLLLLSLLAMWHKTA